MVIISRDVSQRLKEKSKLQKQQKAQMDLSNIDKTNNNFRNFQSSKDDDNLIEDTNNNGMSDQSEGTGQLNSDAIDLDYTDAEISNMQLDNNLGDGLDISGSLVKCSNCIFKNNW